MKCIIKVDGFGTRNGIACYAGTKEEVMKAYETVAGTHDGRAAFVCDITDNVVCTAAEIGWSLSGPRNRMAPHICRAGKEGLR